MSKVEELHKRAGKNREQVVMAEMNALISDVFSYEPVSMANGIFGVIDDDSIDDRFPQNAFDSAVLWIIRELGEDRLLTAVSGLMSTLFYEYGFIGREYVENHIRSLPRVEPKDMDEVIAIHKRWKAGRGWDILNVITEHIPWPTTHIDTVKMVNRAKNSGMNLKETAGTLMLGGYARAAYYFLYAVDNPEWLEQNEGE